MEEYTELIREYLGSRRDIKKQVFKLAQGMKKIMEGRK